jgi:biotin carboxyl carrier protein
MTLQATVNEQSKKIVVRVEGDRVEATWGEQSLVLEIRQTEPGAYHVIHEGRGVTVTVGENGWVEAGGRVFQTAVADPRDAQASNGGGGRTGQVKLTAPMPGKVIRVLVAPGEVVTAGQGLVVVEAMKMQNEMKAPRDATVLTVKTQEAATVAAGDVLMVLE